MKWHLSAPCVYAFRAVLATPEGHEIPVVKVGKTGQWKKRRLKYDHCGVSRTSRYLLIPDWDSLRVVPVDGMAEAAVAEALIAMTLTRVMHLETPESVKEYYLGLSLEMAHRVLNRAAARANDVVATYLGDTL